MSPPADTDGDGIPNTIDLCPKTPPELVSYVNLRGCLRPKADNFNILPDFENLDLRSTTRDMEIGHTDYGKVSYNDRLIRLYKESATTESRMDFDSYIKLSSGKFEIDSTNLPEFDHPATVTLYNLTVEEPVIYKDGEECDECEIISYENGTLVFTVDGFSVYEVVEGGEDPTPMQCNDNLDNDSDGNIDYPDDAGCDSLTDNDETDPESSGGGGGRSNNNDDDDDEPVIPPTQQIQCNFTRSLTTGSEGSDVLTLQRLMNTKGHTVATVGVGSPGNETNYFGNLTQNAVIRYQNAHKEAILTPVNLSFGTGYFGPSTIRYVNANESCGIGTAPVVTPTPTPTTVGNFTRNLTVGDVGEDVRRLQQFLNGRGYTIATTGVGSPGNETTYFGNLTQAALIRFQNANKAAILTPVGLSTGTGYFGPSTRQKVNSF